MLYYSEKTALRTILNLLLDAMHACALVDLSRPHLAKGTKKAESIAVRSLLAMRHRQRRANMLNLLPAEQLVN